MKGIKNIIFDLGGVILNIDYHLTSKAFLKNGFTDFDAFYSQAKQSSLFDDFEVGKIGGDQFCAEISKISQLDKSQIIESWNAMLLDLPAHRIELLKDLGTRYRIFLLSNTNEIHLNSLLADVVENYQSDVLSCLFEKAYYSHLIGMRKPNADCFEWVLSENELIASETLFIDDSAQHVKGAKKAGLNSFLLDAGDDIATLLVDTAQ